MFINGIRFNGKLVLDKDAYTKKLVSNIQTMWRNAIRVFVIALANGPIHVDTGMSLASARPLAKAVGGASGLSVISSLESRIATRRRIARRGYTDIRERWHPRVFKSADLGSKLGETAFTIKDGPVKFSFRFSIYVYQWRRYEIKWKALHQATAAFNSYIKTHSKECRPQLSKYFRMKKEAL